MSFCTELPNERAHTIPQGESQAPNTLRILASHRQPHDVRNPDDRIRIGGGISLQLHPRADDRGNPVQHEPLTEPHEDDVP